MEFIRDVSNIILSIYLTGICCFIIGYRLNREKLKKELEETQNLLEERKKDVRRLERQIANVQRTADNHRSRGDFLERQFRELKKQKEEPPKKEPRYKYHKKKPGITLYDHLRNESGD